MSAHTIFESAPIGAIVAWSDGTPRPPERHSKKLAAWENSNSQGRLIRKQGGRDAGKLGSSGSFTLHEADFGAGGVIAIRVHRTFSRRLQPALHHRRAPSGWLGARVRPCW